MKRPRGGLTVATTLLAPLSWGTTYVTITELLPAGRPLMIATLRVLPAALALLAFAAVWSWWRPRGRQWRQVAVLSLANVAIFFPLLAVAVYRLPGGVAAAAGGLQPLLVSGLSVCLVGRRPARLEVGVGFAAAVGVALVVIRPHAAFDPVGLLAAVGANISFATGVVLSRRFLVDGPQVAGTGWQLLLGGLLLLPLTRCSRAHRRR